MNTSDWLHQAVCREADPELFFPRGEGTSHLAQAEDAKAVCRRCPVMSRCLEWAVETGQDSGIWGGLREDERRGVRPSKKAQPCGTRAAYRRHLRRDEKPCEPCIEANREASGKERKPRSAYSKPQTLAPCGTRSAYQRHLRRKEPIDEACRNANRQADHRLRNTGTTVKAA